MHLLILCSTSCNSAHCALRAAYHTPKMARWQDKVASLVLLSGPAQRRLLRWLWLCCCGAVKVPTQGSWCAQPGRVGRTWSWLLVDYYHYFMRTTIVHVMKHM
jgi:hypothetical protein